MQQEPEESSSASNQRIDALKYFRLLKNNRALRWAWCHQFISLCGDWFNELACITIINKYTSSAFVVTAFLLCRDVPPIIWSPLAGVIADKYDRRKVMLSIDLLCCGIVLLFLLVQSKNTLWFLFVVTFMQFSVTSFYEPASNAFLPQIVPEEDLVAANVLLSFTWSVLLVAGAGIGGVFTFYAGTTADFLVDSASFLLSALCLLQLFRFPLLPTNDAEQEYNHEKKHNRGICQAVCSDFMEGARFLKQNKFIWAITMAKASGVLLWAASELFMVNYAAEKFQIGDNVSLSLGIMYVSSGIGVAVGPAVVEIFISDSTRNNVLTIVASYFAMLAGSIIRAYSENFIIFCLANVLETAGEGCIWVYSSSILQKLVPNHMLGRCSSFEEGSMTLASVFSKMLFAFLRDTLQISAVAIMVGFTLGAIPLFGLWVAFAVRTKGMHPTPFQTLETEEVPLNHPEEEDA